MSHSIGHPTRVNLYLERAPGGYDLQLGVTIRTDPRADGGGAMEVEATDAELTLLVEGARISVGTLRAPPGASPIPLDGVARSVCLSYARRITSDELRDVEVARGGRRFMVDIVAHGRLARASGIFLPSQTVATVKHQDRYDRDEWVSALQGAGFADSIGVQIDAGRNSACEKAVVALHAARRLQLGGDHREAMAKCREALDVLGNEGFGGHAPSDVVNFLKQNAKRMTMPERLSAVQAALTLYLSAAVHEGELPDGARMGETDSTLAIAATTALAAAAATRGRPPVT